MSEFTTENLSKEFFVSGYIDYCKRVGAPPTSTYRLCKFLYTKEIDFSIYFDSIKSLQQEVWKDFLKGTIERLNASQEFENYCGRERLLAFYYTLFENLKPNYKFIKASFESFKWELFTNHQVEKIKNEFLPFAKNIIAIAKETEEIATRPVLENYYENIFGVQFIFLLHFWSHDTSENFEQTDAAIEKSTNLLFDLLQRNAGDAAADFGKFIFSKGFKIL